MNLVVEGICKTFITAEGALEVLRGIDLTVDSGRIAALIGPNGSGKSTLLEIIIGITQPDKGRVLVDGEPIKKPVHDIAMVFQSYVLFPWRTVEGNLRYALEVRNIPRREWSSQCKRYLEMVKLWEFRKVFPDQLSGGMQQRLALARALVVEPRVLLMDEPFAAVDPVSRFQLQLILLELIRKYGTTVLFVTHSIEEALILADRIAIVSARPGHIIEVIDICDRPGISRLRIPAILDFQKHIWDLFFSGPT